MADQLWKQGEELLHLLPEDPSYEAKRKDFLDFSWTMYTEFRKLMRVFQNYSVSEIDRMVFWEITIAGLTAVLGLILSLLFSRRITVPLEHCVAAARNIAQGKLRGERIQVVSTDEIGELAGIFNQMADSLRELSSQNITATENLSSSTAQILASTQQQAASTKEQAAAIQQTTTTIQEIGQSGAQIAERAKQVSVAAEATSSVGAEGLKAVQEGNRTMDAIREQVEAVAEQITALSEKTQAVGEIISTVNDIAEQSNLLALNAAIEAATAGEAGRGFSIVASEIKNLADQAKESTVQIRSILGDIQKGITGSVMLTEEAVKRVETGKKQSDMTEQTIRQLSDTTQESIHAFQQIVAATNQQQIGFDQVTQAVQNIRLTTEQTAAGTLQLEKAVIGLNALAQQLKKSVEQYQI